jgi:transposase
MLLLPSLKKKTLSATEQKPAEREAWWKTIAEVDPADLVFVDEMGMTIALTRLYARAPGGMRAYGRVPRNHGQRTSVLAALDRTGLGAVLSVPGAVDREVFRVYVEQVLGPTLRAGQSVVVDNLAVHKDPVVAELVGARGCQLLFLPPYSPDFNPIEPILGKLKATLRRIGARTTDALNQALTTAIGEVTCADAANCVEHFGYRPIPSPN